VPRRELVGGVNHFVPKRKLVSGVYHFVPRRELVSGFNHLASYVLTFYVLLLMPM
jgi:hypothetical protein